jgi:predicted DNA-binding transcriptional regulator AlpA
MPAKTATKTRKSRELVLGKLEVAELLGVTVETVYQWHARKLLPAGDMTVAGADAWYESTIIDWAKETGRWKK